MGSCPILLFKNTQTVRAALHNYFPFLRTRAALMHYNNLHLAGQPSCQRQLKRQDREAINK